MGKGFQGAVLRALGAREHVVTVSGRDQLAEHFVRIHFRSGTLLRDGALHPDSWIRLWFPNPDNPSTLNQRGYTLVDPDLTSYPAITSIAAAVPDDTPLVVYLERHSPLDEGLPLPSGSRVTAAWVDELPDGQGLAQAIDGRDWSGWFAWIGAESLATRRAKGVLKREHGLGKAALHAQAYWMRGRALGPSRLLDELNAAHEAE